MRNPLVPRRRRGPLLGLSSVLLAILAAGVVVLSSTVPALWVVSQRAERERETAISDACAAALGPAVSAGHGAEMATLDALRQRYRIAAIVVKTGGVLVRSGPAASPDTPLHTETRVIGGQSVQFQFAEGALRHISRTVRLAMTAGIVAGIAAVLLLPIYVNDAIRGRASAATGINEETEGRTSYLLHTFGSSLETLKQRETELKRLHLQEKERADELARLTGTLVRSLTTGFIALDETGRIVDLNQAAYDVLQLPTAAVITGQPVAAALGTSSFARTLAFAHERRAALQRREVTSGGVEPTHIGVSTVPLLDHQGRYLGMLALFADLTDVRRLEQRVRDMQALADLGEMSGGIAHEFRNSLAAILGYLRLARRSVTDDSGSERLRKAEQEALALSAAVERLLSLGGTLPARHDAVELSALVREAVSRLEPFAPTVTFALRDETASILGDAALLSRALDNLVRNAVESIQARGGPGQITISTIAQPRKRIIIEDDGAGIDPAVRLFVPFQSGKPSGFGLGLTLTKKIILMHHGTIRLLPRAGGGAVAEIEFDDRPIGLDLEFSDDPLAQEQVSSRYIL
jgi:signal transduction histidine kinase